MPVGNRRNEHEIIRDILQKDGSKVSALRKSVNLSNDQLKRYLVYLNKYGLIQAHLPYLRNANIQVTNKGNRFLQQLIQTFELVGFSPTDKRPK